MTDPLTRSLKDEVARLRQLRDTVLATLQQEGPSREEKLQAIERAFQGEPAILAEQDEDAQAEEARDRERLS